MKVRFWGVRGSIPSPGPKTVRYGGNTTCIEVRTDDGALIVLDAGTGIFPLAQSLLVEMPLTAHVFITHTHWDHIHGLPFFTPLYVPGNRVRIHGPYDAVAGQGIEQVMAVQLRSSYFPVREAHLRATIEYDTLTVGEPVAVGDATVTGLLLNHPAINLGYRVECRGKSVFFTGDHEPWGNIFAPGDVGHGDFQRLLDGKQRQLEAAIAGVDVLIADCSYTPEEYPGKRGWGHGTFDAGIDLARRVGARRLVCTHHEPTRSDDDLEAAFAAAFVRQGRRQGDPEILLAREGLEIQL
jgi:phosphoribosyl 1,2-cyclic phosphodiesterase